MPLTTREIRSTPFFVDTNEKPRSGPSLPRKGQEQRVEQRLRPRKGNDRQIMDTDKITLRGMGLWLGGGEKLVNQRIC